MKNVGKINSSSHLVAMQIVLKLAHFAVCSLTQPLSTLPKLSGESKQNSFTLRIREDFSIIQGVCITFWGQLEKCSSGRRPVRSFCLRDH